MQNLSNRLTSLIDIPSITGNEEQLANYLKELLTNNGLQVNLFKVEEKRYNLFAAYSDKPSIILTTHMDTVAPFIKSEIKNGIIYGRGACDAKGQICAMIQTVFEIEPKLKDKIGLLFVVGEETNSIGAKRVEKMGIKPDFFINGEPTGNKLVHAQKGVYFFEAVARGKSSHSGYPENGVSAIDILLDFLKNLKEYPWPQNEAFGKTFFNVGKIEGGEAVNALAAYAKAECGFRIVTPISEIQVILDEIKPEAVEVNTISKTPAIKLFCPAGFENTIHVNYGSDVFFLQQIAPTLMLGPGTILDAHTKDEKIRISELEEAVVQYKKLINILIKK